VAGADPVHKRQVPWLRDRTAGSFFAGNDGLFHAASGFIAFGILMVCGVVFAAPPLAGFRRSSDEEGH
jgi:hypothetical protein